MNAIIHFTFIFGVVPRDAIEEKRVPRLVRPPSFSSTPAPFLIPESCEENSQLNDRPTVLLCRPQLFAYFSYLYVASAHSQPASQQNNQLFAPHLISPSPSHPLIGVGRSVLARLTGRSLPPCRSFGRSLLVLVSFVCTALDSSCLPASSTLLSLAPLPR